MANTRLYSPINPHFFQPLLPGFTNHLKIPMEFYLKHLEGSNKNVKTAELRSDASQITWKVKMDGRRLSDGWEDFTIAHDLRVGDIVVFKHQGGLLFHVSVLTPSCCEIQYQDSHEMEEKSLETEADSSTDHSCFVASVTASNLSRDTMNLPKMFAMSNGLIKKNQIVLMNEEGESWKLELRYSGRFYITRGWTSFCVANGKKPGDLFTFKLVQNEETPVLKLFPLNSEDLEPSSSNDTRKGKSSEEAIKKEFLAVEAKHYDTRPENCFEAREKDYLPSAEPSDDNKRKGECSQDIGEENVSTGSNRQFVKLTLTPESFKTCRLNLPLEFTNGNGMNKAGKKTITMLDREGARWSTSLLMDNKKNRTMSLGRGWKGFCEVSGVKTGDSLVLELIWEDTVPVLKFSSKV